MPELTLADIRTVIKAAMEEVPGVGLVNDFEPYIQTETELKQFFQPQVDAGLLGWTITREKTEELDATTEANFRDHLMVIRGYAVVSLQAASEKAFQDLIEAVCDRFRQAQVDDFNAQVATGRPNVRIVEARQFTNTLVHYCEITLVCRGLVAVP
jgi:hypothetical protein